MAMAIDQDNNSMRLKKTKNCRNKHSLLGLACYSTIQVEKCGFICPVLLK